jgi:hypothetical protein
MSIAAARACIEISVPFLAATVANRCMSLLRILTIFDPLAWDSE